MLLFTLLYDVYPGAGEGPWASSWCTGGTEVGRLVIQGMSRCGFSWWMVLMTGPRPSEVVAKFIGDMAVSGSVTRTVVHKPAIWTWASLLK